MILNNKIALVTGSSRGIGAAIAKGYAREGCTVIINYINPEEPYKEVLAEVKKYTKESITLKFDVSRKSEVNRAVEKIIKRFGKIDILVNNAAVLTPSPFISINNAMLDKTLDVNLKGSFYCAQAVAKHMIKNSYGKIINISSVSQFTPFYESVHYAMSKSGIKMLTKCLALELGKHNINVNSIVPGIIKTDIIDAYEDADLMKRMLKLMPLKKIGNPEDIVGAALFLASENSDYLTGINIIVDGGFSLFKVKHPEE
jgi:NAD(P)-dependent dehydrogenase (short-subunit alcohol dehydrogenase family)